MNSKIESLVFDVLNHTVKRLVIAKMAESFEIGVGSCKNEKTDNSNLHGFEVHRPSSTGTKLLIQVIKAIINRAVECILSDAVLYDTRPCAGKLPSHCGEEIAQPFRMVYPEIWH